MMKVSEDILSLVPYKPGKPISETQREYGVKEVYKLASNENPLGASPKALEAIKSALNHLHRYPDPGCYDLVQKISELWSVPKDHLAVGNGSNELIDLLIRIYCEPGESILTSQGAFVAYQVCAQAARVGRHFIPLKKDYATDLKAMGKFLQESPQASSVRLVFIPNPNNPTGTYVAADEVEEFLKIAATKKDLMVVFDEAYNEFVRASDYRPAQQWMKSYSNVCVIRTLSKAYGLAGLRVGILVATPDVIELVNRVRNPFNVNELAQVAATAAIEDFDFIRKSVEITWQGLDYFYAELKGMGLPYIPSQGNFVMFDTLRDVKQVNESLLKRGVILRPIQNYGFMTHLRMSVGLPKENEIAIKALQEVFHEIKPL